MNNTIKQLAGQALDKIVPYTWTTLNYEQIQELQEHFAQLIVEECISRCEKHHANQIGTHASAHNSAINRCVADIKTILD
jgi:hypothetical protein